MTDLNIADWTPVRIIADIEAMIRRDGSRQYCANDIQLGFYSAQLCGVCAHLVPKTGIRRIFTPDTDVAVGADGAILFAKGNLLSLRNWHRHLNAYRKAMRSGSGLPVAA